MFTASGGGRASARRGRRARGRLASRGFALVVVIWGLGLVALLGTMAIVGARYRARDAGDLAAIAGAAAAAESGVTLGILRTMEPGGAGPQPSLIACTLPDRAAVRVRVTREAGKVDLNAAPLPLLARLFTALTRDPARGQAVARAVVAYRSRPEPGPGRTGPGGVRVEGPKHAPFLTTLELDQVEGLPPDLVAAALPHVTVLAGRPDPDPEAATPELLRLLDLPGRPAGGAPAGPAGAPPGAPAGPVTVRAEARTPGGAVAVREALVAFGTGAAPYTIAEWRRGELAPGQAWEPDAAGARACLR